MVVGKVNIEIVWDWQFFALFPAVNFNGHNDSLEFEWLCLGIYINFKK